MYTQDMIVSNGIIFRKSTFTKDRVYYASNYFTVSFPLTISNTVLLKRLKEMTSC